MSDSLPSSYVRFSVARRVEHAAVMTVFTLLVCTGFPQRYATNAWAQDVVASVGGVGMLRFIHRTLGVIFAVQVIVHFGVMAAALLGGRAVTAMVPNKKDFTDAVGTLRYYLGLSRVHPKFDRYDYRQKFEYWGMAMGSLLMILTGFMLLFPTKATALLPGQLLPAAKVAHSNEGLMALLVIIVWHVYNSVLNPEVFPMDTAIFTGRISRERMLHEHPLELARLEHRPVEELHHGD